MFKENVEYILSSNLTYEVISDDEHLASLCTFVVTLLLHLLPFITFVVKPYYICGRYYICGF